MGKRNRKSTRWTAGTLLAVLSLMAAATCAIPAYAQQPDAPTPTAKHRKQDRAGIAFVSNGIKKDHQIFWQRAGAVFCWGMES